VDWINLTISDVNLEYSLTGNFLTNKKSIGLVPNTGLAKWTIPDDNNISDNVLMRVSDPNDYEARDDSDNTFRITASYSAGKPY